MSRSVWKGPFVDPNLIKKVEKLKGQTNTAPIKTWSRKSQQLYQNLLDIVFLYIMVKSLFQ